MVHAAPRPGKARVTAALVALLICHAVLALTSLRRNSVTIDEFSHLPAGLTYWQRGTFALYHHNPPLVKMLAALPVLAARPLVDYGGSWARAMNGGYQPAHVDFGREFMRANATRYFDLFNRGRWAIVALSVVGCLLVFFWARDLWGPGGGLLAAGLWAFDPNVLAHAGLVTTDIGAAVGIFATVYLFWRWLRSPTWLRAAVAGSVLGLALLTKFSALILLLILPALAVIHRMVAGRSAPARQLLLVPVLGLLVLNAGYGFEGSGRPLGSFPFLSPDLTVPRTGGTPPDHPSALYRMLYAQRENRFAHTLLGRLPTPLPEQYVLGFDDQRFESNIGLPGGGYAVYLRGEVRRTGWWNYYLYAMALKVPLGTWLLVATAIAVAVLGSAAAEGRPARPRWRLGLEDEAAWGLPALIVLVGISLMTGLDLGVRYLLPMFPFLFVACGRLVTLFGERGRTARVTTTIVVVALLWNVTAAAASWPHYISYFNEAAGGPAGGHRYLIDSNLDWGQDLLELKRWLDRNPQPDGLALAYFGAVNPDIAGIHYRLPPRDPRIVPLRRRLPGEVEALRPGVYAISVNFIQGLPHWMTGEGGEAVAMDQDVLGYFRTLRPFARAGRSIWIYRLDEHDVERLRQDWGPDAVTGQSAGGATPSSGGVLTNHAPPEAKP